MFWVWIAIFGIVASTLYIAFQFDKDITKLRQDHESKASGLHNRLDELTENNRKLAQGAKELKSDVKRLQGRLTALDP